MSQYVFEMIVKNPGIDTPLVCLNLHKEDMVDPDLRGFALAKWLMEWHRESWEKTCKCIDVLIENGQVTFSDDGELNAVGYQYEHFWIIARGIHDIRGL